MKKILAENTYGHGAVRHSKLRKIIQRLGKPIIGKSSIPFDWTTGINHYQDIPIKNQSSSSSCGGQAASYWLEIIQKLKGIPFDEMSAKSIYSQCFYPNGGTTVSALSYVLSSYGANSERLVPSYVNGGCDEISMEDTTWKNDLLRSDALTRSGWKRVSVNIDIESMAEAIRDYGAVIIEIQGQNNGTWLSPFPKPPTDKTDLWAHFMCCGGAKLSTDKQIDALQSWGNTVGDSGVQHFTQDYINSGYIVDCFTFTETLTSVQQKNFILQALINFWKMLST